MRIEIITTGDEIMSGTTLDTNFNWAAGRLTGLGFDLRFHTSVGDDEETIIEAMRTARRRSQAVIISGGLGPTPDDLTASAASRFFGVPLELDEEALGMMKKRFEERGYGFLEINEKQAYIPRGARILKNLWGTAPGFQYETKGVVFFFLPGVPKEFREMIDVYVIPELERRDTGRRIYESRLIRTFGLRESEVAERLKGIERNGIRIGYRAHFPEVHLRVSAYGDTEEEARGLVSEALEGIKSRLGECVFSTEGETLEEVVGRLLSQKGLTIAVAESCTGGLIAHRITNVPGSSDYFERGIVSYSNESKVGVLGVPRGLIESFGAVSREVVEAMAEGVRRLANTDIGIGVSGIAGPGGGTPLKPVGTVFIGISHREKGTASRQYRFYGTREEIKLMTSQVALDWIRKFVLNEV
ncbi:MAG TPA: competence/damage-inducible protein A [Thermodesulfobacteriota bacterium]|jgi:nicotinamide-nucleotide amidase|nr:competence/damage-inducible protein A [Thermodesulfobacteriota bacterium]